jgi:hypothetical protein
VAGRRREERDGLRGHGLGELLERGGRRSLRMAAPVATAGFIRPPENDRIARKSSVMRRTVSQRLNVKRLTGSAFGEVECEAPHHIEEPRPAA